MDYYEILSISRSATDQDIKRAYRKLAMRWHPDKNKSNEKEARETFQDIAEAYDVLSDPEKRAIYDQYGYDGLKNGVPDENGDMRDGYEFTQKAEDIFNKFFGTTNPFSDFGFGDTMPFSSSLRKKGPAKCPDIERKIECTLEELYKGGPKTVSVERKRLLNGEESLEKKSFTINIKPGWKDGFKITYDKEGNESKDSSPGDVVFIITTLPHSHFERAEHDLIYKAPIKLIDALADCVVEIPTLDGRKIPITCNDVLSPKSEKIVKGEGMPITGQKASGNLRLQFDIKFPTYLSETQKKSLLKILPQ